MIAIRFTGCRDAEAIASALEVAPGPGPKGDKPIKAMNQR